MAKPVARDARFLLPSGLLVTASSITTPRASDAVASCFRGAVFILQREPEHDEPLHVFLGEAVEQARSAPATLPAACRQLGVARLAKPLHVSTGEAVDVRIPRGGQSNDTFADGYEEQHTTYLFTAGSRPEQASTTLTRRIGEPPPDVTAP